MEETNNVLSEFPHKLMEWVIGPPTYETIYELHQKINANAASILSTLGRDASGHLGLTLSDAWYFQETGIHYTLPVHPGATPVIAAGTNALSKRNERATHIVELRTFNQHVSVSNALTQNIVKAIDEIYLGGVKNSLTGYLSVTSFQMIQHLYRTKGKITSKQLESNTQWMNENWNPNKTPMDSHTNKIKICAELVDAAEEPYYDTQMIRYLYTTIKATGKFTQASKEWRLKLEHEKMWANLKTHMIHAYEDFKDDMDKEDNTFKAANVMQQDTIKAIQDLTEATLNNRETIKNFAQANSALTWENNTLIERVSALENKISRIEDRMVKLEGNQEHQPWRRGPSRPRFTKYYGWSCGIQYDHDGKDCTQKKAGHINKAT